MKILIVDDNKQNIYMLQTLLEGHGNKVISASNGAEALEKARTTSPGIIISDIMMPVMDGFTLCHEWKKDDALSAIPFVFYTATYTDERDEELAMQLGADKFIRKPVEPVEFIAIIQKVLEETEQNKTVSRKPIIEAEENIFKLYNERLILKLEKKMLELEKEIAERKRTEVKLRKSEEKYRTLFSSTNEGLALHEVIYGKSGEPVDYKILDVNPAYESITGIDKRAAIGTLASQLYGTGDPPFLDIYAKVASSGVSTTFETTFEPIDRSFKISVFQTGTDRFATLFADITERKNLEEQLRQAQKMEAVGQLAGGVAHDFNNFLTAIIGFASIIKMKIEEDSPLMSNVDHIITSANKAAYITRSLLAFSRKQIINLKPVRVNESIQNLSKFLIHILGENIELQTLLTEDNPRIMADSVQIDQVLINLVTNARDAIPNGGKLNITTDCMEIDEQFIKTHGVGKQGMYVLISISDTGIGMDEETKNKIFEPFFTTKDVGEGTGLGMSVLYGIVKQHEGFIVVLSEQGKGTTFEIYFPVIIADVEKETTDKIITLMRGSETVLVAEDEDMARILAKTLLEEFGYTVIEATNGLEAVEKFIENKNIIQLLLLDVFMPKKNGKEVLNEIMGIKPGIKAIFTSGYPKDIISKKGILDEGLNFISKPISPHDLLIKVRDVLDN